MAQKRNALGRGLDALLSMDEVQTEGSSSINEIELSKIVVNPNQPRHEFDETALQELADSISEIGIIQPITLRTEYPCSMISSNIFTCSFGSARVTSARACPMSICLFCMAI